MQIKNKKINFFIALFIVIYFFTIIDKAFAATAIFSPSSGSFRIGDTIRVNVLVSSDKSINAFHSSITFSKETLTLSSISKSSSIIDLWPREATFSNSAGSADFEGVILNGYTGNSGNMATLLFKARSIGKATISFANVSILANDGEGTDIFSGPLSPAVFEIGEALPEEVEKKEPVYECNKTKTEESPVSCVVINMAEKINEVENENNLPDNSLLISITILIIIILCLIVIYLVFLIARLKKYFKEKLSKTEAVVDSNFRELEKDINSKMIEQSKEKGGKMNIQEENEVLGEVMDTEGKIIKEVEEIKKEI